MRYWVCHLCSAVPLWLILVGRTMRTLHKCIGEFRSFIHKVFEKNSVPRHFLQMHNKNFRCLEVMMIEAIPIGILTDNKRFSLLRRRDIFWIYYFSSLSPNCLNVDLEVHIVVWYFCFILYTTLQYVWELNALHTAVDCLFIFNHISMFLKLPILYPWCISSFWWI